VNQGTILSSQNLSLSGYEFTTSTYNQAACIASLTSSLLCTKGNTDFYVAN